MSRQRRVVVTGATGNLGTALLATAPPSGWAVTGLARRLPHLPSAPAELPEPYDRAEWVSHDLTDSTKQRELVGLFAGADAVVHLAWPIQPRTDELPKASAGLSAARHTFDAAAEAGVGHVVVLSSVAAYSPGPRRRAVDESWPCGGIPGNTYSRAKAALEEMLDAYECQAPDVGVARVRPCAVVQPAAGPEVGRWTLPPWLPRRLLGSRLLPVPVWRGLRAQAVHAEDVGRLLWAVLERGATGPFNAASEPALPGRELARAVGGFPLPVPRAALAALAWASWRVGLQPAHPAWLSLADKAALIRTDRARTELGWVPRYTPAEALAAFTAGVAAGTGAPTPPLRPGRRVPAARRPGASTHQRG